MRSYFRDVIDGKASETELDYIARISLEFDEVCKGMCEAYSHRTHVSDSGYVFTRPLGEFHSFPA